MEPQPDRPLIDLVAGARPNFMKLAPVMRALGAAGLVTPRIVHTGQHYDPAMNDVFFAELGIPAPGVHLDVGSGTHGAQTARLIERYERHLMDSPPAGTVVFGDVNSTAACTLAAVKLGIPVAHVEAGLRSRDRSMPEEINRIVTDVLASLLLVSEQSGLDNLRAEGIADQKVRFVGNVMIDTLKAMLPAAEAAGTPERLGLKPRGYGLVTLHRPSNVDDPATLKGLIDLLHELSADLPLVFPLHPRTQRNCAAAGFGDRVATGQDRLICLGPLPYIETLSLLRGAAVVLTDSGGIQEETSVLSVPCLTLRENTERPVTTTLGTSRLVGNDLGLIRALFADAISGRWAQAQPIPLWDGAAGTRVAAELARWMGR